MTNEQIMQQLYTNHPNWFSRGNVDFSGDTGDYWIERDASGTPFMARSTYAWTDMFGKPKVLHYRLNTLRQTGEGWKLGTLVEVAFDTQEDMRAWLEGQND